MEITTFEQKKGSVSLKTTEIIQSGDQGENGMKEHEQCLVDVRSQRRREGAEGKISEETLATCFPNVMEGMDLHIQDAQLNPSRENSEGFVQKRCSTARLSETQERTLKAERKKWFVLYKEPR